MGGVVPFGPDATVSPRESILSVANHGPTSIRTSGQRGSRSGPRCLLGFADWPRTSGGMRAPPLGFPLVLPLCPGSPWPAVGGIVFLSSWHILGDGRASPWSSAGRGLWAPSRQAGERVSAAGGGGSVRADPSSGPSLGHAALLRAACPLKGVMCHHGRRAGRRAHPGRSRNACYPHHGGLPAEGHAGSSRAPRSQYAGREDAPRPVRRWEGICHLGLSSRTLRCRSCRRIMG